MSKLLEGKTAVIAGVANKWSLAFAIAESFAREGATIILTYLNEKQKETVESMAGSLPIAKMLPCDVTKDEELAALAESLRGLGKPIDVLVHSLAFANRDDLSGLFLDTQRDGFLLAQNVSAYSLVALARAVAPLMTNGGSIMTLTYIGSTRVVAELQRHGRRKGFARSLHALSRARPGTAKNPRQCDFRGRGENGFGAGGEGSFDHARCREGTLAFTSSDRTRRSGRRSGLPRQRPEPRGDRKHYVCRFRHAIAVIPQNVLQHTGARNALGPVRYIGHPLARLLR